jgi:large subunit ribosomal protein L22
MEAIARLRNYPSSPRKMRLIADIIRGVEVEKALNILKFSTKHTSVPLEKLLLSAVANWGVKNAGQDVASANLYVKTIYVDGGRTLKRMNPAPQGRAYRLRKRSNHVTLIVDSKNSNN